jgi:multidrug efflux pump subunit AcrB
MAFAIMGGLMVATLLTLILLPTIYVTLHKDAPAPTTEGTHA